jgi:hypothetical protein
MVICGPTKVDVLTCQEPSSFWGIGVPKTPICFAVPFWRDAAGSFEFTRFGLLGNMGKNVSWTISNEINGEGFEGPAIPVNLCKSPLDSRAIGSWSACAMARMTKVRQGKTCVATIILPLRINGSLIHNQLDIGNNSRDLTQIRKISKIRVVASQVLPRVGYVRIALPVKRDLPDNVKITVLPIAMDKPDLTEPIAVDYVASPDAVDLQSYGSIDALAAAILATSPDVLDLRGLSYLSEEVASELSHYEGPALRLSSSIRIDASTLYRLTVCNLEWDDKRLGNIDLQTFEDLIRRLDSGTLSNGILKKFVRYLPEDSLIVATKYPRLHIHTLIEMGPQTLDFLRNLGNPNSNVFQKVENIHRDPLELQSQVLRMLTRWQYPEELNDLIDCLEGQFTPEDQWALPISMDEYQVALPRHQRTLARIVRVGGMAALRNFVMAWNHANETAGTRELTSDLDDRSFSETVVSNLLSERAGAHQTSEYWLSLQSNWSESLIEAFSDAIQSACNAEDESTRETLLFSINSGRTVALMQTVAKVIEPNLAQRLLESLYKSGCFKSSQTADALRSTNCWSRWLAIETLVDKIAISNSDLWELLNCACEIQRFDLCIRTHLLSKIEAILLAHGDCFRGLAELVTLRVPLFNKLFELGRRYPHCSVDDFVQIAEPALRYGAGEDTEEESKLERYCFERFEEGKATRLETRLITQVGEKHRFIEVVRSMPFFLEELQNCTLIALPAVFESLQEQSLEKCSATKIIVDEDVPLTSQVAQALAHFRGEIRVETRRAIPCAFLRDIVKHRHGLSLAAIGGSTADVEQACRQLLHYDGAIQLPLKIDCETVMDALTSLFLRHARADVYYSFPQVKKFPKRLVEGLKAQARIANVGLKFGAVDRITVEVAECLADYCGVVSLPLVATVDEKVIQKLKKGRAKLMLPGLTTLNPALAEYLVTCVSYNGSDNPFCPNSFSLSRLQSIDVDSARELAKLPFRLQLDGLEKIAPGVAIALSDHVEKNVDLSGVTHWTTTLQEIFNRGGVWVSLPPDAKWLCETHVNDLATGFGNRSGKPQSTVVIPRRKVSDASPSTSLDRHLEHWDLPEIETISAVDIVRRQVSEKRIAELVALRITDVLASSAMRQLSTIDRLVDLSNLVYLQMGGEWGKSDYATRIGDTGARALAEMDSLKKLRGLNLFEAGISNVGLGSICCSPFLQNLQWLVLSLNHIDNQGFKELANSSLVRNLRRLDFVGDWSGEFDFKPFFSSDALSNLCMLDLSGCEVLLSVDDLAQKGSLPKLKDLRANATFLGKRLPELLQSSLMPQLEQIELSRSGITSAAFKRAMQSSGLSKVTRLGLCSNNFGAREAELLAASSYTDGLRDLYLSWNQFDDRAINELVRSAKMHGLKRLALRCNSISEVGLKTLIGSRTFEDLEYLDMDGNAFELTDNLANFLLASSHLNKLKGLQLSTAKLSDSVRQEFCQRFETWWKW